MKSLDLGSERAAVTVMKLAFPAMLAQLISVLYSIVDRIFVGNIAGIGEIALAGLGVCAPVATLISAFASLVGFGGAQGDRWITVSTIVLSFMSVITMPLLGISTGTQPVLSFNYGAKKISVLKKAERFIVGMGLVFTSLMFVLSFALARPIAALFTDNEEIISLAQWGIRTYMIGIVPLSLQYVFVDGLTGLGQPKFAFFLSMSRKMVVFLGCLLLLPRFFGVEAVFYAEPIADIFSAVLSTVVFAVVFPKILGKRQNSDSRI